MGRQESLIRVESLAAVAGIDRAVRESEELKVLECLDCVCAARAKQDLYRDHTFFGMRSLSDVREDEEPIAKKGDLFAVVVGARLYQPFLWLDCIAGLEEVGYLALLEDIPLQEAYKESELNPEAAREAECFMRRSLNKSYSCVMQGRDPIELPAEFALPEQEETGSFDDIPF